MKRLSVPLALSAVFLFGFSSAGAFDEKTFVNVAKKVMPSVVNISTTSTVKVPYGAPGPSGDLFRRFFDDFFRNGGRSAPPGMDEPSDEGDAPPRGGPKSMSLGTGFVIDASGLIMTNNHVVADADEISIFFTESPDEKPISAEVVGRDPEIDLALIKVKAPLPLIPVVLGDSDRLEVGEMVLAIGNPFGQGHSVSHGIISAKDRVAPDFVLARYIQTDAPINPGNSGGPLVNLKGEVIGINNAIDQRAQGIGFAIPINLVKTALPQLKTKGSVSRGYVGIVVEPLTTELAQKLGVDSELRAPFVTHVYPNEPAAKAGVKPYDVVLSFNGKKITNPNDLIVAVTTVPVGETATLSVMRGSKKLDLKIRVAERPDAFKMSKRVPRKAPTQRFKPKVDPGLSLEEFTPEIAQEMGLKKKMTGVIVSSVAYGSPADRAGVLRGDVVLEVDRKAVGSVDAFFKTVSEKKSYLLRVLRLDPQGRESFTVIVLDLKDA